MFIFSMLIIVVYNDSLYPVPDTYVPKHLHTFNEFSYQPAPDHPVYILSRATSLVLLFFYWIIYKPDDQEQADKKTH